MDEKDVPKTTTTEDHTLYSLVGQLKGKREKSISTVDATEILREFNATGKKKKTEDK